MIQFDCITKPDLEKSHIWIRFSGFHSFFLVSFYTIFKVCVSLFLDAKEGGRWKFSITSEIRPFLLWSDPGFMMKPIVGVCCEYKSWMKWGISSCTMFIQERATIQVVFTLDVMCKVVWFGVMVYSCKCIRRIRIFSATMRLGKTCRKRMIKNETVACGWMSSW